MMHLLSIFCILRNFWMELTSPQFLLKLQYFRPICNNSRIQPLQKKKLATFSHIMATNTYLRGRQHAESTESKRFHKLAEENCTNNNNSPPRHCKNALRLAEFGTFSPVARHAAMLC